MTGKQEEKGYKLPTAWWIGVGAFKKAIARAMVYETGLTAELIWSLGHCRGFLFEYCHKVTIGVGKEHACVGIAGKMNRRMARLCSDRDTDGLEKLFSIHAQYSQ